MNKAFKSRQLKAKQDPLNVGCLAEAWRDIIKLALNEMSVCNKHALFDVDDKEITIGF